MKSSAVWVLAFGSIFGMVAFQAPVASAAVSSAPGAPVNLSAIGAANSITVTWEAPTLGAPVDKYEINWQRADVLGDSWSWGFPSSASRSYTISSLPTGMYNVRLYAVASGCSTNSDCYSDAVTTGLAVQVSDGQPGTPQISIQGDIATLSWDAPAGATNVIGYEYKFGASFISTPGVLLNLDPTYYSNGTIVAVSAAVTRVVVRLPLGNWQGAVRAKIGNDEYTDWVVATSADNQDWFVSTPPSPTLSVDYPRIYSQHRTQIRPVTAGISTEYSLAFVVGDVLIKTRKINSELGTEITWQEINECSISSDATVRIYLVFLSAEELSNSVCTDMSVTQLHLSERKVLQRDFEYLVTPVPIASATFVVTQPGGNLRYHTAEWLDNETPTWYSIPGLVNNRDPLSGARFLRWLTAEGSSVNTSYPPQPGQTYSALWEPYLNPMLPFNIEIGGSGIDGSVLRQANHIVWNADGSELSLEVNVKQGVHWRASLAPIDRMGNYLDVDPLYLSENGAFDLDSFSGCSSTLAAPDCPDLFRLFIISRYGDGAEDNSAAYYTVDIIKDLSTTGAVTRELIPSALQDDGDSSLLEALDGPSWYTLEDPSQIDDWNIDLDYFVGWCRNADPQVIHEECYMVGDVMPLLEDTRLYATWVEAPKPSSIQIGEFEFFADDWIEDIENQTYYLTLETGDEFAAEISIIDAGGISYNDDDFDVERIDGTIIEAEFGEYSFSPNCPEEDLGCSIYSITGAIESGGRVSGKYLIMLLVTKDADERFDVVFDATPGNQLPLLNELIAPRNLSVGWHAVPQLSGVRPYYETDNEWSRSGSSSRSREFWWSFFPVLSYTELSLDIWTGPEVLNSTSRSVTIIRGQTNVVTLATEWINDFEWRLSGSSYFSVSPDGNITVAANVPQGNYSLQVQGVSYIDGPPVQIEVSIVESSSQQFVQGPQIENPSNGDPERNSSTPGSKQQPPGVGFVGKSKLGIGGTTVFIISGGLPDAVEKFTTRTPKICSISKLGLVTAIRSGVCLVSASLIAIDPVFAPSYVPEVRITILPQGLINSSRVTESKGRLTINISLLKAYAGKQAKLVMQVRKDSRSVQVPVRTVLLSRTATASFAPVQKSANQTKYLIYVGGKAVYSFTL